MCGGVISRCDCFRAGQITLPPCRSADAPRYSKVSLLMTSMIGLAMIVRSFRRRGGGERRGRGGGERRGRGERGRGEERERCKSNVNVCVQVCIHVAMPSPPLPSPPPYLHHSLKQRLQPPNIALAMAVEKGHYLSH